MSKRGGLRRFRVHVREEGRLRDGGAADGRNEREGRRENEGMK